MLFICYPQCQTCRKAQRWLDERGIHYQLRNIKTDHPSREELTAWQARSRLPLKRFWNTSGQQYRTLALSSKLPQMTEVQQLDLLAGDGMLVKRPLLVDGDLVLVGFNESEWADRLG